MNTFNIAESKFWNNASRGQNFTKVEELEPGKKLYTEGTSFIVIDVGTNGYFDAIEEKDFLKIKRILKVA